MYNYFNMLGKQQITIGLFGVDSLENSSRYPNTREKV